MSTDPASGAHEPTTQALSPSLDSDCDNPTRWEKRLSGPEPEDLDSGGEPEPDEWSRQQKRVFHRVNTLLHYWESREYDILWITLTSSPDSDPASELAYNLQRLRQRVERAELARGEGGEDGEGEYHRLSHITELEQLCIRTSEGPEGKGVLHLFWAWEPLPGNHSRELFIPQKWLSEQWGDIHGGELRVGGGDCRRLLRGEGASEILSEAVEDAGLWVWVEEYGTEDYHDRKAVARYCVSQYLGEHGEALEHVSWSHGRTLGGSLVEAWEAVREHREKLSEAIEAWETVIAGDPVNLGSQSEHVHYGLQVNPPPNLGVEVVEEVSVEPPEEYQQQGPDVCTVRTVTKTLPEYDPDRENFCPECGQGGVFPLSPEYCGELHPSNRGERVAFYCLSCDTELAPPGQGQSEVVEREIETWDVEPVEPDSPGEWEPPESGGEGGTTLLGMSRQGQVFEPDHDLARTRRYMRENPGASVPEVLGRFNLPPECAGELRVSR